MIYSVGDLVTISGAWTDANGNYQDPAAVFAEYKDPAGNVTTLTYPTDTALVRDSVGLYHVDIDANQAGHWHYRFYSTGTGQGAEEKSFRVKPSSFVSGLAIPSPPAVVDDRLFADSFSGTGQLTAHVPDTVWRWGGWFTGGFATDSWTLNGDGSVSNASLPTGAQGTQQYYAWYPMLTYEPAYSCTFAAPASGVFKCGIGVRMVNQLNGWMLRVNSTNHHFEILRLSSGSLQAVSAFVDLGSTPNGIDYTIVGTVIGTTITASCNGIACPPVTAAQNPTAPNVAIFESVTSVDGHAAFKSLTVELSSAAVAQTLIVAMPSDAIPTNEWDTTAVTGTGTATQAVVNGNGRTLVNITANASTSAYRFEFYCDASKRVPNPEAPQWTKNLPDEAYYTCYYWFPTQIQPLAFWNIFQWKQRAADSSTSPLYFLNVGWTVDHMHFELDAAIDANGAYNGAAPDPAPEHYAVPVGQWFKIEAFYKWSTTNGRLTFWLDNSLMWDVSGLKTQFSTGADWNAPKNSRLWGPCHYSGNLGAGGKIIYIDNASIAYLRQADNYPTGAPV